MFRGFSPEYLDDYLGSHGIPCEAIRSTDLGPIEGPAEQAVVDVDAGLHVAIASNHGRRRERPRVRRVRALGRPQRLMHAPPRHPVPERRHGDGQGTNVALAGTVAPPVALRK